MQFADLNEINIRAAWPDEARDFHPMAFPEPGAPVQSDRHAHGSGGH